MFCARRVRTGFQYPDGGTRESTAQMPANKRHIGSGKRRYGFIERTVTIMISSYSGRAYGQTSLSLTWAERMF